MIDFDAVMSVKHDADETALREPFNIYVVKDGTPIVEFQDSTAIAFSAEDLVNDALWFIELDDADSDDGRNAAKRGVEVE